MLVLLLTTVLSAAPLVAPDTVVVTSPSNLETLRPWLEYRQSQGHRIALVTRWRSAEEVRDAIRHHAAQGSLNYVVLVGDSSPAGRPADPAGSERDVPTHHAQATVNVKWGSEPEIATDNWYADLDDDQLPDVAIGRLTANTPADLALIVQKILAYETRVQPGHWHRQLNFVAGVGGFGGFADRMIEGVTKKFLTEGIPPEYNVSMTYGSWRSPYCPDPRRFRDAVIDRFNEGCLFWIYMGHGQRTFLDRVQVPGGLFPIMDTEDVPRLQPAGTPPIAIFLSCYTGAFDGERACLAELMLASSAGPVAVLAGSRVTMPYAMGVMGNELLCEYFQQRPVTLGQWLMQAKRKMVQGELQLSEEANSNRRLLDALAATLSDPASLEAERREHVLLFNLLGDPLLRLRHPERLELDSADEVPAGTQLTLRGYCSLAGRGTAELVCRRDRFKLMPTRRARFDPSDGTLTSYTSAYDAANDRQWVAREFEVGEGPFETRLAIPADAHGPCYVRVFVEGQDRHALGSSYVFVRRSVKPAASAEPAAASSPD